MDYRFACLVVALSGLCSAAPQETVVTGTTSSCVDGKTVHTSDVEISVFPRSEKLASLIDSVLKATDANVFDRFDKLIKYVKGTKALARTTSDATGSFRVKIPLLDNVTVFGYMETEDNPFYWMHSEVDVAHRSAVSVVLSYCKR
jgi:hypothetical protein